MEDDDKRIKQPVDERASKVYVQRIEEQDNEESEYQPKPKPKQKPQTQDNEIPKLLRKPGEGRFLRADKPGPMGVPKASAHEQSPWQIQPGSAAATSRRDKSVNDDAGVGIYDSPVNESIAASNFPAEDVLVVQTPELGELNQITKDDAMYHLEEYNDDENLNATNKMAAIIKKQRKIIGEDTAKGVFDKKDNVYETRRTNPLVPEEKSPTTKPVANKVQTKSVAKSQAMQSPLVTPKKQAAPAVETIKIQEYFKEK